MNDTGNSPKPARASRTAYHAVLVAAGIMASRLFGLVRDRVFAYYFGNSDAADAFRAAFRIPNFLQNLFGEGVLSASFIPVYAELLGKGDREGADRVAGAVGGILMLTTSVLVALGILATPLLIGLIAPGFTGAKRELCITLVRILFPGAGVLVWSAWCLGILNSHGRFLLSYAAPVAWNLAIIAVLLALGDGMSQYRLAEAAAWASVGGSLLQLAIQLPTVRRVVRDLRLSLSSRAPGVRTVIRNFVPVFFSRGVVQVSAYVDSLLASLLPTGAVAALSYAQTLYTLPVSLFGMSVAAAELPAMARSLGAGDDAAEVLRTRLDSGLRRIAFFIIPSAAAFMALGDIVNGAIYQTGQYTRADTIWVWGILAGYAVGLLASTMGRLYSSAFYALKDTRTPLRFAVLRVVLAMILGYLASQYLPDIIGVDRRWGIAGLTLAAGCCGWIEFVLLRRSLNRRIGATGLPLSYSARLWFAAGAGAAAAWGVKVMLPGLHPVVLAIVTLGPYGIVYLALCYVMRIPELAAVLRLAGRLRR